MTTDNPAGVKPADSTDQDGLGLNEGGRRAIEAERRARREAESETKRLRDQLAEHDRTDLIRSVAASKSLPAGLAERLRGNSREELEADADALLALVAPAKGDLSSKPKEALYAGASPQDEPVENAAVIAERILR